MGAEPNGRTTPVRAPGRGRIDYKWIVVSVTTLGALLSAIDSSIVILALPSIMEVRSSCVFSNNCLPKASVEGR